MAAARIDTSARSRSPRIASSPTGNSASNARTGPAGISSAEVARSLERLLSGEAVTSAGVPEAISRLIAAGFTSSYLAIVSALAWWAAATPSDAE